MTMVQERGGTETRKPLARDCMIPFIRNIQTRQICRDKKWISDRLRTEEFDRIWKLGQ